MVQSVELVFDEALEAQVRSEWRLLADAGLDSQARHTGESNRPHVTLGVARTFTAEAERSLAQIGSAVQQPVRLGGLLVFGGRVLSRAVIPTAALLDTHARVCAAMGGLPDQPDTTAPDRWTPHVTLARRLDPESLAAAVASLAHAPRESAGMVAAMRRWDSDTRTTWTVTPTI